VPDPLQQWTFDRDGEIENVGSETLTISGIKDNDSSITSYYFSLDNVKTHMLIGVAGNTCLEKQSSNCKRLHMADLASSSLLKGKQLSV
jgi:hypothetical protein